MLCLIQKTATDGNSDDEEPTDASLTATCLSAEQKDEAPPLSAKAEVLQLLFDSYRPCYWYFEVIECTRRLALTAVLSVVATGSSGQVVLAMMVSFGYICLYAYCQPYKKMQISVLASVGQTQIYFTFFGALIISNDLLGGGWNVAVGALLVVLNTAVLLISFKGEVDGYRASQAETEVLQRGLRAEGMAEDTYGGGKCENPLQLMASVAAAERGDLGVAGSGGDWGSMRGSSKGLELISFSQKYTTSGTQNNEKQNIYWEERIRLLDEERDELVRQNKAHAKRNIALTEQLTALVANLTNKPPN